MTLEMADKRVGIVIATPLHHQEFWFPYHRFREAGAQVLVAGPSPSSARGGGSDRKHVLEATIDHRVEDLPQDLDVVFLPGGSEDPLWLRTHKPTLELVRRSMQAGRIVAALCHAQWILVSADVLACSSTERFRQEFTRRFGYAPHLTAYYAHDAAGLLLEGIDVFGADRESLKLRLPGIRYTRGITGPISFDDLGNRHNAVRLSVVRDGRPVRLE